MLKYVLDVKIYYDLRNMNIKKVWWDVILCCDTYYKQGELFILQGIEMLNYASSFLIEFLVDHVKYLIVSSGDCDLPEIMIFS